MNSMVPSEEIGVILVGGGERRSSVKCLWQLLCKILWEAIAIVPL